MCDLCYRKCCLSKQFCCIFQFLFLNELNVGQTNMFFQKPRDIIRADMEKISYGFLSAGLEIPLDNRSMGMTMLLVEKADS